jgi:UDP-N-acetylmuramyl-tripeptide synthetase
VSRQSNQPSLASEQGARLVIAELQAAGVAVKRLVNDSRRVQAGDVFVAYPGAKSDGRMFIDEVIERGAAAVLAEADGLPAQALVAGKVPVIAVQGLRSLAGELAALVCGRPSIHLRLIGITGTNGKTSTTHWVATTLALAGQRCATIGTLGNGFPGDLDESANTTPDALALHSLLARYLQAGAGACAMEVSSIGLEQSRCAGAHFGVAVFTNLTRDHLDYHGSMEAYARAKERLFVWPELETAVINVDDPFGAELLALTTARRKIAYSMQAEHAASRPACDIFLRGENVEDRPEGFRFALSVNGRLQWVEAPLIGHYNVANLLAVAGALLASGIAEENLAGLLGAVRPVAGRMQRYGGVQAPLVAVDYAHTPDALANALAALRPAAQQRGGRLVCVFGCGGDRDRGKRPLMGEVAAKGADEVWLTSDNPRSEEPQRILEDIAAGAGQHARRELDRSLAITRAIAGCSERDVILVAGKGHENYQEVHGRKLPYSDALVVNAALAAWLEAEEQKLTAAVSSSNGHDRKAGDE